MDELRPFPVVEILPTGPKLYSAEEYDNLVSEAFRSLRQRRETIQLIQGRSIQTIALVHACLLSSRPFAFLPDDVSASELCPKWVTDRIKLSEADKKDQERLLFSKELICYVIRTSGSTGKPKVVAVPHRSIWPNILDFRKRFSVTENDRVLFSTSLLFDPSIVEIFLCFLTGATMILVPDYVRSSPHLLTRVIREHKPTLVQFTPALFKMFTFNEENRQLMASVRTILLGGEKFPLAFVDQFRESHLSHVRLYDVYGVTEVSSWATVFEVKKGCAQIPLGDVIEGTSLRFEDGAVYIEGPRLCIVNDVENSSHWTGDWALQTANGWILQGRLDNVKKLHGIQLNLDECAEVVLSHVPEVVFARFLIYQEEHLLLFVKFREGNHQTDEELIERVRKNSPRSLYVTVIAIQEVPLTNNGKVNSAKLLEGLKTIYTPQWRQARFWQIMNKHGIREGMDHIVPALNGINSLTAAELAILLGDTISIRDILAETTTVALLVEKLNQKNREVEKNTPEKAAPHYLCSITEGGKLEAIWQHDMKKCIDGSPLHFRDGEGEDYLVAASHSGMVLCMNHTAGRVSWMRDMTGRRLEASPAICDGKIVIGSYDGHLLIFDSWTGQQLEGIQFEGGSIRGQAAVHGGVVFTVIYLPDGTGLLSMFRLNDRQQKTVPLAAGSPARPTVLPEKKQLIVTTIKGTVEMFQFSSSEEISLAPLWKTASLTAIFSPATVDNETAVVTSATGAICRLNLSTGHVEQSVRLDEPFFAPIFKLQEEYLAASQKGSVFVLDRTDLRLLRNYSFPSCSFVKAPSLLSDRHLILISKDGRLLKLELDGFLAPTAISCRSYQIGDGEVFHEPCFTADAVAIGCRDDHLRVFRLSDLK